MRHLGPNLSDALDRPTGPPAGPPRTLADEYDRGTEWYYGVVEMTIRLTDEDAARLTALADAEGVSLHEAVLRAVRRNAEELPVAPGPGPRRRR